MKPKRWLTVSPLSEIRAASEAENRSSVAVVADVCAGAFDRDCAGCSELVPKLRPRLCRRWTELLGAALRSSHLRWVQPSPHRRS